jgi:hypothetical protein
MSYVTIYRAPNINIAWIMQDYFVTNDIDATISIDEQGIPVADRRSTEDLYPFPSFILVPEEKAARATELLKQFKLV